MEGEKPSQSEFAGEKYYNKTALTIYCVVLGVLILDKERDLNTFELLVAIGFFVIWTYLAGLAIFIVVKALIAAAFAKSDIDKFTTEYLPWIAPGLGFLLFTYTLYFAP